MQQYPFYRDSLVNWYPYFSQSMGSFFLSNSHPMIYFITWKMLNFFSSVSHTIGKCSKTHVMGKFWDIDTPKLFPKHIYFPSIKLPIYDLLHHMGNTWVFPSTSRSIRKCYINPSVGEIWDVTNHTFPKIRLSLFHQIINLRYFASHGKCMGFPINFL